MTEQQENQQATYEDLVGHIDSLNRELRSKESQATDLHQTATAQSIVNQNQQNLIQWQLDISEELELIGHQLRGHVLKRDKSGNERWTEPEDDEQKIFNEKGAQEIEKVIRNYLIKNILLSNFDMEQINQRIHQFANRLRRFIYLNFEDFGMDTEYKQKHFEMIVMNITDQVEAAYMRALGGEERESLRRNIHVTQTGTMDGGGYIPQTPGVQKPHGSKLNPMNWFR